MGRKETKFGHDGVTLIDWGQPEYLDGARMRFLVTDEKRGGMGTPLGYFGAKADAELFAFAKAELLARKKAGA